VFFDILESDAGVAYKLRYGFVMLFTFLLGTAAIGLFFGPAVEVEWNLLLWGLAILFVGLVILGWCFPQNGRSFTATFLGFWDGALLSIFIGMMIFLYLFLMAVGILLVKGVGFLSYVL